MSMVRPISAVITFGVFRLDIARGELKRFDTHLRLAPQPLKLLALLVSRPGEIVTREEIQQQLWGTEIYVDFERGLNHCIRQIRAVLGDDPGAPAYIETVPRTGYRFVAPVTVVSAPMQADIPHALSQPAGGSAKPGARHWGRPIVLAATALLLVCVGLLVTFYRERQARPPGASTRQMVAVLPFENLTGDPAQEYLSDGVTDEMNVHLGRVSPSHLGVIARTSAMNYKHSGKPLSQIASELGVKYLLEGTVKRFGLTIRITAQLVRSDDQTELWADTYDGQVRPAEILGFQQSVADRVARSLSLVLPDVHTPQITTASQAAYEAFLKGRYELNKRNEEGFLKSIDNFKEAVAQDPGYAEAWAGLADSYNLLREYYEGRSSDAQVKSGYDAAFKALALDSNLSEAHASLAFSLWRYEWKFAEAETEFHRALDLSPNNATAHHWYGMFLASRGRFDEARNEMRQAQELDPVSLIILTNKGWVNYYARNYDAAIQSYREVLKRDSGFQTAEMKLAWACEQKGMWAEALQARQNFYITAGHPEIAHALADAFSKGGYSQVLRTVVAETEKPDAGPYYSDYEKAKLYAMLGDTGRATMLLERARAHRSGWLVYLAVEPAFDKLRADPALAHLIDQSDTVNQR